MNFSKRSRYGIRALIDLAENTGCSCMQLSEIADRNSISVKYLEQIFASLRKAGILRSIKGPQGGYLLGREPESLKISEIVLALEGSYFLENEESKDGENGGAEALAIQTEIIDPINELIDKYLNSVTLKDLVECAERYKEGAENMYYI